MAVIITPVLPRSALCAGVVARARLANSDYWNIGPCCDARNHVGTSISGEIARRFVLYSLLYPGGKRCCVKKQATAITRQRLTHSLND
jgi:hypothetical protein